jgi:hypothetical protein
MRSTQLKVSAEPHKRCWLAWAGAGSSPSPCVAQALSTSTNPTISLIPGAFTFFSCRFLSVVFFGVQ